MHHIDVHVRDIAKTKRLFDAVMPAVGWQERSTDPEYVSYWRNGVRPSLGFIADGSAGSAMMQLAFAVATNADVDAVAAAARKGGAANIEGPAIHPEYGDDYYAVFFEDADGNKFEVLRDA
jgi:predicted enzyme related to lactoylglutathione lyase